MVATRFVTTYECDASDAYKQAYIQAKKEDIVLVQSPVGMPGRAVRNDFIRQTEKRKEQTEVLAESKPSWNCRQCLEKCNPAKIPYCITDALVNAVKGNVERGLIFCGTNAYRAEKLEHVSEIMEEFSMDTV